MISGFYSPKREKKGLDLSRETEKVFKLVAPFATDLETGEIINKSSQPKLVESGSINIVKKIQEYQDDVDIYSILDKVLASGDETLLKRRVGSFADIVGVPDNINDFNTYMAKNEDKIKAMPKEVGLGLASGKMTNDDISKLVQDEVKKQVLAQEAAKAAASSKEVK